MRAGKGRIRLYLADIRPLYQDRTQRYVYERLDEIRQKKADACRQPKARAASLAAGFLAQYALQQNGFAGHTICYGEKGQPQIDGKGIQEGLPYLSLSHSGDYAVCAIADSPVGVDIQARVPVYGGMLCHFFSPKERAEFEQKYGLEPFQRESAGSGRDDPTWKPFKSRILPEAAAEEFLRLWTAKESYMKLTGIGMGMGFSGILADLETGVVREKAAAFTEGRTRRARLKEYPAPEGYFLTACIGG